jgi:hypothetical protein
LALLEEEHLNSHFCDLKKWLGVGKNGYSFNFYEPEQ